MGLRQQALRCARKRRGASEVCLLLAESLCLTNVGNNGHIDTREQAVSRLLRTLSALQYARPIRELLQPGLLSSC